MLISKTMLSSIDYSHVPAHDAPRGVTGNFIDPPTIACSVLEVSIPLSVISTVFVMSRIYTRWTIVKSLGWDDLLLGFGLILSWVFCTLGILEVQHGYGVDLWNIYTTDAITFLKLDLASQTIYHLALLLTKLSILLTLLHLSTSSLPSSAFRISVYGLVAFTNIYSLASTFVAIFGCSPIRAAWDIRVDDAKCVNKAAYWYFYASCNMLSSCAIFGLGLVVGLKRGIFGRGVGIELRSCLAFVVALGSFICVVSIVRLAIMVLYLHSENFTKFKVYVERWCEIELTSSLILSSILVFHPLFSTLFPGHFPLLSPQSQPSSLTPSRTCKMSTSTSQPSIPMSRVSSRRNVSLDEIEIGLTRHESSSGVTGSGSGGSCSSTGNGLGERRVLGGSVGMRGVVIKTVVYDVKYEA